jgi:hypothetical protein
VARRPKRLQLPDRLTRALIVPRLYRRGQSAAYINASPSQFDLLRLDPDFPEPITFPSTRNPNGKSRVPLWDVKDLDAWIDHQKAKRDSDAA